MEKLQKIATIATIVSCIIVGINGLIDLCNKVELMKDQNRDVTIIVEYIVCDYTEKEKIIKL